MAVLLAACCTGALEASLLWSDKFFRDAEDIVTDGDVAYVATAATGVLAISIANPASPTLLGVCTTQMASGLHLSGSLLYVADYNHGLAICNVQDPSAPTLVGTYDCPGCICKNVDVVGTKVYLRDSGSRLFILSAADPTAPIYLGNYTTHGIHDVRVVGSLAYVATGWNGLEVVNVTDPTLPVLVGTREQYASSVAVQGTVAYVGTFSTPYEVHTVDIADPSSPVALGGVGVTGRPYDLTLIGTTLYAACNDGGVQAINTSNLLWPSSVGSYDTLSTTRAVASTDTVVLAAYRSRLQVLDASDASQLEPLGQYSWSGVTNSVRVAGTLAVVCEGMNIRIFNVSHASAPAYLSTLALGTDPQRSTSYKSFIDDSFVYVVTGRALEVVDITDPLAPSLVGSIAVNLTAEDVWADGSTVYVAGDDLVVFDVSSPSAPRKVAAGGLGHSAGVMVVGDVAYVTVRSKGLCLVDVSTRESPTLLGLLDTPGMEEGVFVVGAVAYVATSVWSGRDGGLQVVDVSDPAAPKLAGSYIIEGEWLKSVHVAGDVAYAAGNSGLYVFDVSDVAAPVLLGTIAVLGYPDEVVHVANSTVYVAATGLQVYDVKLPAPSGSGGLPFWVWMLVCLSALGTCGAAAAMHLAKKRRNVSYVSSDYEVSLVQGKELQGVED